MSAGSCRIRTFLHQVTGQPEAVSSECMFVPGIFLACYSAPLPVERQTVSGAFPLQSTY